MSKEKNKHHHKREGTHEDASQSGTLCPPVSNCHHLWPALQKWVLCRKSETMSSLLGMCLTSQRFQRYLIICISISSKWTKITKEKKAFQQFFSQNQHSCQMVSYTWWIFTPSALNRPVHEDTRRDLQPIVIEWGHIYQSPRLPKWQETKESRPVVRG